MPLVEPSQITFIGALNAQSAPDKVADNECVTANNIDFSLAPGAAVSRRGSIVWSSIVTTAGTSSANIYDIFRNYNNPTSIGDSPYYAVTSAGAYRTTSNTWTQISTAAVSDHVAFGTYRQFTLFAPVNGEYIKDDGTNATDWIKQSPANAPTLNTINFGTLSLLSTGNVVEGTGTFTGGTWTATTTDTLYRVVVEGTLATTNLAQISGNDINDYGVDYIKIAVSDPTAIVRVSRDYSIGDTSFTNYFHTEVYPAVDGGRNLLPGVDTYLESQPNVAGEDNVPIGRSARNEIVTGGRGEYTRPATEGLMGRSPSKFYNWAVARPNFQMVGLYNSASGANPWSNIQAVRVVIEATAETIAKIGDWYIQGDELHSLTDPQLGYSYWLTYATIDSDGVVIDESAASPRLGGVRLSQGQPVILHTGTATGSHGITHKILYRQGGLLSQPYAVSTATALSTGAFITVSTFTDTLSDIKALTANNSWEGEIYSKGLFPRNPSAIVEYQGRVFIGYENVLAWSTPGRVGTFPVLNFTEVSSVGDEIQALHVYGNSLVIVNRDSVYVMRGSIFEGEEANWILSRSGSRHGCKAARVATCKTPYGIPLLDYDGLTFFDPGGMVDVELDWLTAKAADMFRGTGTLAPAYLKGQRIPPINKSFIRESFALYTEGKLYLACPTNAYTIPYTIFVIDFATKRVWTYDYGYRLTSGFWDFVDNKILVGAVPMGKLIQIETGLFDQTVVSGTNIFNPINYTIKPKMISAPSDFRLENLVFEIEGGTSTTHAILDNTSTYTLGTLTGATRDWSIPPFNGSAVNNVQLSIHGVTSTDSMASFYGIGFSAIPEPQQIRYFRTEYDNNGGVGENLWDVHHASMDIVGTGTITGVAFIDSTAVMTMSYTGPTNGRVTFHRAFPNETYGNIAYTTYTSTSDSLRFKLFDTWHSARKEPPRINNYHTDWQSLDENICDAHNVDINPNGTVTATIYVDNVATNTFTYVGNARQSFVSAITSETYGRTIHAVYNGSGFKHYNTWWDLRPEPDRMTNFVTSRESQDESWIRHVNYDINPLGNIVSGTVFVDGTAVTTCIATGNLRQSFVHALPDQTYGRTVWVSYNALTGKFKHYNTWFDTTPEPDRVTHFHHGKETADENWFRNVNASLDCLNNVVTAITYINGTAVSTNTMTGSGQLGYVWSLPDESMGREISVYYQALGGGKLKHYNTWFDKTPEPDRIALWHERVPYASENYIKTWIAELNPQGTCVGTMLLDGTAVWTNTFTGTRHQVFNVGVDVAAFTAQSTGTVLDIIYNAPTNQTFKHYRTQLEAEPKPFGKKTWQITYRKVGGASRVDNARSYSLDIESNGTSTITSVWYVDGRAYHTNTLTFTNRQWKEWIPLPPDGRGYLFHQEIKSDQNIRVWASTLDMLREGAKGVARAGFKGEPQ